MTEGKKIFVFGILLLVISLICSVIFYIYYNGRVYNKIVENSFDSPNEDFSLYVGRFYTDLESHNIHLKKPKKVIIKFSRLTENNPITREMITGIPLDFELHGVSHGAFNDDLIEIYIDKSSWEFCDSIQKYYLMYHELGHDVLNLPHLNENYSNYKAIMYPVIGQNFTMEDFIESSEEMFSNYSK